MAIAKILLEQEEQVLVLPPDCAIFDDGDVVEFRREGDSVVSRVEGHRDEPPAAPMGTSSR